MPVTTDVVDRYWDDEEARDDRDGEWRLDAVTLEYHKELQKICRVEFITRKRRLRVSRFIYALSYSRVPPPARINLS